MRLVRTKIQVWWKLSRTSVKSEYNKKTETTYEAGARVAVLVQGSERVEACFKRAHLIGLTSLRWVLQTSVSKQSDGAPPLGYRKDMRAPKRAHGHLDIYRNL